MPKKVQLFFYVLYSCVISYIDSIDLIYLIELDIKDTTDSTKSRILDLQLEYGNQGTSHTSFYDKRDDFDFIIVHFTHLSSNVPSSLAYGVYISQPIC